MKCKSVACIWSASPPVHRVTASAVLDHPPTLYTGGSDGSIIWWNLISSHEKQEIKPIAMLCGHAAPIADLRICFPAAGAGNGKSNNPSNVLSNSNSVGALISACTDGVLCIWSRAMGHCKRRRKLPPWVGSPSMLQPLPENGRYVCIACCFGDYDHLSLDPVEEAATLVDKESQQGKPSKYTVVIVDSYTLTIVQTIFHGNLSIGPLKSLAIIVSNGEMEKWSVMIIDSFGKVQYLPILKNFDSKGETLSGTPEDSAHLEVMDCADGSKEKGLLVTFAKCGQVIALVYRTYCAFRLVDDHTILGKISFLDDQLCLGGKSHVVGGMFLGDDEATMRFKTGKSNYDFMEEFAVWNDRGSAVIYRISYSCNMLMFERLAAIPATLYPPDLRLSIFFIPLKKFLLRIESICFSSEEPSLWKPHVTVWLLPQHHVDNGKLCLECEKLGEGNFFDVWAMSSTSCEIKGPNLNVGKREISVHDEMTSLQSCSISSIDANMACTSNWRYGTYQEGKPVSSSMVISDNYLAPCAIVYGFFNGDIEVVRFNMFFMRLDSHGEGPHQEADACAPKQYLLGHTGAVLCLASHPMMSRSGGCILNHVLLSGSKDCTVRIWDLDTCNPITVLHQHVAPVRQIILPPHRTARPWSDCFLTVGDDSSVALASLETLRVERMFPGHPSYPAKVMWDGVRGYVACFCPNSLEASDALDVLYIWDVKTGARERVLRGAAAHSMFDHFSMVININDPSGIVMNVNTSASSLNFPITEETKFSKSYSKYSGNASSSQNISPVTTRTNEPSTSAASYASKGTAAKSGPPMLSVFQSAKHLIKSSCPFPGIATLSFDLTALMSLCSKPELFNGGIEEKTYVKQAGTDAPKDDAHTGDSSPLKELGSEMHSTYQVSPRSNSVLDWTSVATIEHHEWVRMFEGCLLQFSLSLLHLWNVDHELDNLLVTEMKLKRPDSFIVASGLLGDRGSLTLTFPGSNSTLELWKSSPVYSAMRSLTMVSLAQHLISLSHSCSSASSALAAFYTRKFAEKIPDIKPPLLQVLVSFWQDEFEHVKMAARSLFHCAASRAIPLPLCSPKVNEHTNFRQ
ncbi:Transducin/WD40 repeat-like superfamily protein [Forsythia ovata]|uniref:Transducin/WD40 repeat-like superfamily protein n=1 Tax=Forsythia ovata TaxID=205694 RepID=A0ABD1WDA8_9LAMI